jgi:OmpA-OmpF porin, OOP family
MSGGVVAIPLPEVLPDRFTVEFDFAGSPYSGSELRFDENQGHNQTTVTWTASSSAGLGGVSSSMGKPATDLSGQMVRLRLMVDGRYAKLYMNETRVANVPNAKIPRTRTLTFHLGSGHTDMPILLGNIRIAAGGKKLYDVLAEKGRVATHGIYFSSGSDRIRPESTPTLKEIGVMLKEHPELKLTIEGHTDNVGDAEANHTLSHLRASAVKKYLETTFDIGSERLTSTGFGAKKPVAKNDTPEGRQQNRRVELVRG